VDGQATGAPRLVEPTELRRAAGQFATGVTVVTVHDGEGVRGMTANSFISVSLDPPLILVSVIKRARTHRLLETLGTRFAVSVLAEQHRELSDRFAGRQGDVQGDFSTVPHWRTDDGLPVLDGALTWIVARVVSIHGAGDHSLFVGAVEDIGTEPGAAPLIFFAAGYRSLERP
jgi:flavin reductase (DIM6/NTAB) family NADH-FMN oxidoreductase RutF